MDRYVGRFEPDPARMRVLRQLLACRTAALGTHLCVCEACGWSAPVYNPCRNRHCPQCQGRATALWLEARQQRMLPVPHFQVVFTLPAPLRPVAFANQKLAYGLLFQTAASVVQNLAAQRLDARLGITAVLHTWTTELSYHPHVHLLVTAGGLGSSLGFPETGIGIFPGLGGMPRLARQVGPDLAAYYVLTGRPIGAGDASDLGLVAALVPPGELDGAIRALASLGAPDKNRARVIPERFHPLAALCAGDNLPRLLAGESLQHEDQALAAKTLKTVGFKAPIACRIACELIHAGKDLPVRQAAELELGRLTEIFSTADALEGLSSVGRRRPKFEGV